ncbi:MAG: ribonuclease HII [Candidatus Levybacteria bacterium]|nr:ribonuclease HII [Candidatus Levybacteria bacterium]
MKLKTKPSFEEEICYWNSNISHVIGLDEVGRGAFAGPIVAAGVIFKPNFKHDFLDKVNDSKLVKPKLREELSELIKANSVWEIASVELDFINKFGIGKANLEVFKKVLNSLILKLKSEKYFVLVDGFDLKIPNQKPIIKGDQKSLSIAAASIIAKVYRDNLMREAGKLFPNYLFEENKGYGTLAHRNALRIHGLSTLHRIDFCKNIN